MIECAAVKIIETGRVYSLCRPNRHCNVLWFVLDELGEELCESREQGFLDHRGHFLTRRQAAKMAFGCRQIDGCKELLFTEDLWFGRADESPDYYPPPGLLDPKEPR